MVTFIALAKIYFTKFFCNTEIPKFLSDKNFMYMVLAPLDVLKYSTKKDLTLIILVMHAHELIVHCNLLHG